MTTKDILDFFSRYSFTNFKWKVNGEDLTKDSIKVEGDTVYLGTTPPSEFASKSDLLKAKQRYLREEIKRIQTILWDDPMSIFPGNLGFFKSEAERFLRAQLYTLQDILVATEKELEILTNV